MEWRYLVEEITVGGQELEGQLSELGNGGWEAVTSWSVPGSPHINQGAWRTYILFKKPKKHDQ
jgi:hypothetical protein